MRSILRILYLSPLGVVASILQNFVAVFHRPFMVYGYYNRVTRKNNKFTRISSSATIIDRSKLDMGDNTWVWHHSIIDASNSVKIGNGCQIGAWVGIFTHSSTVAIRLLGERYICIDKDERLGYKRGPVEIGEYTFVGASSLILPGVKIGKGCIIGAGCILSKSVPDYSIVAGNPGEVVGETTRMDSKYFDEKVVQENYYDKEVLRRYRG